MTLRRINPNETIKKHLLDEVGGLCPFCGDSLLPLKNNIAQRAFAIAHIYPLNPTPSQQEQLLAISPPSIDINSMSNLIATCDKCHRAYDTNLTKDEYDKWVTTKKNLSKSREMKQLFSVNTIESDVQRIVDDLTNGINPDELVALDYRSLKLDSKFDGTIPFIIKKDIESNVEDYFQLVQRYFREIDKIAPYKFDTIAAQIHVFYLKCRQRGFNQLDIYQYLVEWLINRTNSRNSKACEIIISFFIQNCEVF